MKLKIKQDKKKRSLKIKTILPLSNKLIKILFTCKKVPLNKLASLINLRMRS